MLRVTLSQYSSLPILLILASGCETSDNVSSTSTTQATSTITKPEYTPPVLTSVSLTPNPAFEGDTLVCTPGTTIDDDGTTTVSYSYAWHINGADPGITESQLSSEHFSRDQAVTCTMTANDGTHTGQAVMSDKLVISNTPPAVENVRISPNPATATDILLCEGDESDVDGDNTFSSTVEWQVNGTFVGSTNLLFGVFESGDGVTCVMTPNDGTDDGLPNSATILIDNDVPSAPVISIVPDPPVAGVDDIVCSIDTPSSDTDGDVINYTIDWQLDGVAYAGAVLYTHTVGDTIPLAVTEVGQAWLCTVTPDDGIGTGASATVGSVVVSVASFERIQIGLSETELTGWRECYSDLYADSGMPLQHIQEQCNGSVVLVGCKETGSTVLDVAAQGLSADVFFDTGTGNTGHEANGIEWYYSDSWSMGFVEPGDGMNRDSCDTETGAFPHRRLCFHTGSGNINGGYRCGVMTGLNKSADFTRVFFTANGPDSDGDGYDSFEDCADSDPAINPGVAEIYGDGIDNDCDGEAPNDDDGDGWTDLGGDCNDLDADIHPGAPDISADGIDQNCDGYDEGELMNFTGIITDVPESALSDWTECYRDDYGDSGTPMTDIQASCGADQVMVACSYSGSSTLTVAAQADASDVFYDTGTGNVGHEANGVEWYYDDSWSWGFIEPGDGMSRNSCDTGTGAYPEHRLCFHTGSGTINGGYRCGETTSLNASFDWERVIYFRE